MWRSSRTRIKRYDKQTMGELLTALASLMPESQLILDLRGNVGGNLQVAADCAGLFYRRAHLSQPCKNRTKRPLPCKQKRQERLHLVPSSCGRIASLPAPPRCFAPLCRKINAARHWASEVLAKGLRNWLCRRRRRAVCHHQLRTPATVYAC